MNKTQIHLLFWIILLGSCLCLPLAGAVPEIINHQGRVTVNGVNFDGMGDFKFALVDAAGTTTFWSHDGTSGGGGEPTGSISLKVDKGLYSVGLGNDDPPFFMDKIPASIFEENSEVFLRIWRLSQIREDLGGSLIPISIFVTLCRPRHAFRPR